MALYAAKSQGRNNYKFYSSNLNTKLSEQMAIENSLRRALERKEFRLYYQPVINSANGEIIGAEALIRWQHPDLGIVLPDKFIPLAEATGMITPITEWVIEQACNQLKKWHELPSQQIANREIYMAINLSAYSFTQDHLLDMISHRIKTSGIPFSQVELEITESTVRQNLNDTISALIKLRQLGIQIVIDDFGVGYSSLSYLKRFPVDKVKIDKCFVQDMLINKHDEAITIAIIELAHSLNLGVVAEGVGTPEQLDFLQKNHCELIQGYLFSQPVPADQLTHLLVEGKRF